MTYDNKSSLNWTRFTVLNVTYSKIEKVLKKVHSCVDLIQQLVLYAGSAWHSYFTKKSFQVFSASTKQHALAFTIFAVLYRHI
jgi:hypothetical protein